MSRDRLLALGQEYSIDILEAAESSVSARELSDELEVPIATCYRRIETLVDAGLLEEVGRELSDRGRQTTVYRRSVEEIQITFEEEKTGVEVTERPEQRQSIRRYPGLDR